MTAVVTANQGVTAEAMEQLRGAVRGTVVTPDDPGYDAARVVYNAMIDKRPALIVQCVDVADVIQGVSFAAANDLPICVRGGGHNAAGLGTCDDGVVIDLGRMKAVHVNPGTGRVLVEGGPPGVMSITPPLPLDWPFRAGSSRPPGSVDSPSAAVSAISAGSTASRSTI
jgi:hypothetical protein